ncbi:hypothetical protein [Kutzneria buriramensis]|uniref:Uncharacterized protein n=1 Tax=Kutzneria buriramensis TaxID=1045776 RepID=A0A3E0H726_9PSEU|nr:hypothetical protein [Kutzneria buriramensis]REH39270.1 hypothetical protein BCF44_113125 [Kutzneria buriramensis]
MIALGESIVVLGAFAGRTFDGITLLALVIVVCVAVSDVRQASGLSNTIIGTD